jgi:hypothetical protein
MLTAVLRYPARPHAPGIGTDQPIERNATRSSRWGSENRPLSLGQRQPLEVTILKIR